MRPLLLTICSCFHSLVTLYLFPLCLLAFLCLIFCSFCFLCLMSSFLYALVFLCPCLSLLFSSVLPFSFFPSYFCLFFSHLSIMFLPFLPAIPSSLSCVSCLITLIPNPFPPTPSLSPSLPSFPSLLLLSLCRSLCPSSALLQWQGGLLWPAEAWRPPLPPKENTKRLVYLQNQLAIIWKKLRSWCLIPQFEN